MTARRAAGTAVASLALLAGAASGAGAANLSAELSADQLRTPPAGVSLGAAASFRGTLTAPGRLAWRLTTIGATGPVLAAHVHLGGRGVDGPAVLTLCAPCANPARGTVGRIPSRVAAALRDGRANVRVRTAANPAGELRGQVGVLIRADLTQAAAVPPHPPRPERRGVRSFSGLLDGTTLQYELFLQGIASRVTRTDIRRAPAGRVVFTLCAPCGVGRSGTLTLTEPQRRLLRRGMLYVHTETTMDPAGYSRGRIPPL